MWFAIQSHATSMVENLPPVADAGGPYKVETYPPGNPQGGEYLYLDGSGSFDPDYELADYIVRYEWDLNGDGAFSEDVAGVFPTVSWDDLVDIFNMAELSTTGTHTVVLAVTDTWGHKSFDNTSLTFVSQVPLPPAFVLLTTGVACCLLGKRQFKSQV